jgi:hypothetical protein
MAGLIDDRQEEYEELDEEVEVDEVVDNDEGIDLDGDQDEEIDADTELEEESSEYDEVDDSEILDEQDGNEDEEDEEDEEIDGEADEEVDQDEPQVSEKDAKIAELERQQEVEKTKNVKLEKQVKETLELLGIKVDGNIEEVLDRVAAEAEGKTLEEYRKEKDEKTELENARQALARQKFEQLAANDLAELKKSFPDLLAVTNIKNCFKTMEEFAEFGRLRDAGVAPKTAYMAVNGEQVRTAQAKAAQKKVAGEGKRHITSVAPKKASDTTIVMPKETLREWRDNFPELSDAEIRKLYKETL